MIMHGYAWRRWVGGRIAHGHRGSRLTPHAAQPLSLMKMSYITPGQRLRGVRFRGTISFFGKSVKIVPRSSLAVQTYGYISCMIFAYFSGPSNLASTNARNALHWPSREKRKLARTARFSVDEHHAPAQRKRKPRPPCIR